jgi:hypothetical protein
METTYNTKLIRYSDLQEGKYYLHSEFGIVRLDDKPNICVTAKDGESYLVKLDSLSKI